MEFWLGVSEVGFRLAPQAGLEPATQWLTVICSTSWAIGELIESYLIYLTVSEVQAVFSSSAQFLPAKRLTFLGGFLWLLVSQ